VLKSFMVPLSMGGAGIHRFSRNAIPEAVFPSAGLGFKFLN
jgi:hypothetical protein